MRRRRKLGRRTKNAESFFKHSAHKQLEGLVQSSRFVAKTVVEEAKGEGRRTVWSEGLLHVRRGPSAERRLGGSCGMRSLLLTRLWFRGEQVRERLPWFLAAKPSVECPKGGAGAYTDSIQMDTSDDSGVAGLQKGLVASSSFRTFYVPLSKQADFINAMAVGPPPPPCLSALHAPHSAFLPPNVAESSPPAPSQPISPCPCKRKHVHLCLHIPLFFFQTRGFPFLLLDLEPDLLLGPSPPPVPPDYHVSETSSAGRAPCRAPLLSVLPGDGD